MKVKLLDNFVFVITINGMNPLLVWLSRSVSVHLKSPSNRGCVYSFLMVHLACTKTDRSFVIR